MATVEISIQAIASSVSTSSRRGLSSIRDRVVKNLGNDNDYFTDDDVETYILQEMDDCAEKCREYELVDSTTSSVSGTRTYTKPTNCIGVNAITFDNKLLDKIDKKEMLAKYDQNSTPTTALGTPSSWCQWSLTEIAFYPTPNIVKVIGFHYFGYPDDISGDGVSSFIRSVDKCGEFYATYMMFARDGENGQFSVYKGMHRDAKNDFLINVKNYPQYWGESNYFSEGEK